MNGTPTPNDDPPPPPPVVKASDVPWPADAGEIRRVIALTKLGERYRSLSGLFLLAFYAGIGGIVASNSFYLRAAIAVAGMVFLCFSLAFDAKAKGLGK